MTEGELMNEKINAILQEIKSFKKEKNALNKRLNGLNHKIFDKAIELAKTEIKEMKGAKRQNKYYYALIRYVNEKNNFFTFDLGTTLLNDDIYFGINNELEDENLNNKDLNTITNVLDKDKYVIVIFQGEGDDGGDSYYQEIGFIKVEDIPEKIFTDDIILCSLYL